MHYSQARPTLGGSSLHGLVRPIKAVSGGDQVVLVAQNLVFGVKRLDGPLGSALSKATNHDGRQQRHPEKGQDDQQHPTCFRTQGADIAINLLLMPVFLVDVGLYLGFVKPALVLVESDPATGTSIPGDLWLHRHRRASDRGVPLRP